MPLVIFGSGINYVLPSAIITCLACFYVFIKYFRQPRRSLGLTLILILTISDFIFSLNQVLSYCFADFFSTKTNLYIILYFGCMHFSILWASVVSFMVYKSLLGRNFETTRVIIKAFLIIFIISAVFTFYWNDEAKMNRIYFLATLPLIISLIATFIFYSKSIAILKRQSDYDLKSTSTYIRTLRQYSLIQLVTFGPLMVMMVAPMFWRFDQNIQQYMDALEVIDWLATLSGLFTSLAFICRGSANYNTPHFDHSTMDLTTDMIWDIF